MTRPRLLPKSEVDKRKAEEQRQAIHEGLKVAERVDTLRETLAGEEVAFEQYRTNTLKDIQCEIEEKRTEVSTLSTEVSRLSAEKALLLEPLDAKWDEVNEASRLCNEREERLSAQKEAQDRLSEELTNREREVAAAEERADNLTQAASAKFAQAETMLATARQDSADMRNKAHAELLLIEVRQNTLAEQEEAVAHRETALTEKEAEIKAHELDLDKREQTLRAGWKSLERTANKLKLS